jgi:putative oxidoreductase
VPKVIEVLTPLAGRILLSLVFLVSGLATLGDWAGTTHRMAGIGIPFPHVALAGAVVLELAGAGCVLTGLCGRLGALALIVFLVPATLVFHNFWQLAGAAREAQLTHFMKNLAIVGGLAMLLAAGPGPLSLDDRRRGHAPDEERSA